MVSNSVIGQFEDSIDGCTKELLLVNLKQFKSILDSSYFENIEYSPNRQAQKKVIEEKLNYFERALTMLEQGDYYGKD